jgi:hypothetical protein
MMSDTYTDWQADHSSVPPLTAAIMATFPKTMFGNSIGPVASDASLRAVLDALRAIENRVIALEG